MRNAIKAGKINEELMFCTCSLSDCDFRRNMDKLLAENTYQKCTHPVIVIFGYSCGRPP